MKREDIPVQRKLREAFVAGAKYGYESIIDWHQGKVEAEAKLAYPIRIEEVRALRDPEGTSYEYGVSNGQLQIRWMLPDAASRGNWYSQQESTLDQQWKVTPARVKVWAQLLDRPNVVTEA